MRLPEFEVCGHHDDCSDTVKDHEKRIKVLEIDRAESNAKFDGLIERIGDLITMIKWFIGLTLTGLAVFAACIEAFK